MEKYKDVDKQQKIITAKQFDRDFLLELFKITDFIKKNENEEKIKEILKNKIFGLLFYEASTRTKFSFESAILKLGGKIISSESAGTFSSYAKGETMKDTVKVMEMYCDCLIIRHFDESEDYIEILAKAKKKIINAGCGKLEHPTQTLLDLYTIYENFKRLDNLKIGMVGDLLRGRTINSLVYVLSKFNNNKFYFVSPKNSKLKESMREHLIEHKIDFVETEDLEKTLKKINVCYMTRIQKERFELEEEYEKAKGQYVLNSKNINLMEEDSIVLHPLPRIDEITTDVDTNKRAKYFEQANNGLYVRMALLKTMFKP